MADRKPLVLVNGRIRQLDANDFLDANVNEVDLVTKLNDNANPITKGQPVYTSGAGEVDLARANALSTAQILGLVKDATINDVESGKIQTDGVLMATTGEWDAVTGDSGGLTPGADYFLSPTTAGMLTTTPPSTIGQFVTFVGRALSTTELEISHERPIEL